VAVGAVSFYIDKFVTGRVSRFTYGIPCAVVYCPFDPEHTKREHKSYIDIEGEKCLPDAFSTMLSKGTKVLESREIRTTMRVIREGAPARSTMAQIMRYDGNQKDPRWMDIERDKFETLCHVVADISTAPHTSTKKSKKSKKVCSRSYDVVLLVGLTELKAQIRWIDSRTGAENSSDATVVYDDVSENSHTGARIASYHDTFDPDF